MSKSPKRLFAIALWIGVSLHAAHSIAGTTNFVGIGRDATTKEVAAWDIDVRPDFKGLPAGSGSVAKGQDVWEAKCANCHGFFGESGEVFSPLVGGVTKADIQTGRVANLQNGSFPGRTTFMKVPTISTVWDYINRAMPWNAPKTLTPDEVYAVTAFLLNLSGIVADDFTLSEKTIHEVQQRMPNRHGVTTNHSLWPGREFKGTAMADTYNTACMKNCAPEPKLASLLPDFARNAHGNLAEQNRLIGAQRGVDTTRPEQKGPLTTQDAPSTTASTGMPAITPPAVKTASPANADNKTVIALLNKHSCTACHGVDKKIIGPAFTDIAKKYPGNATYLVQKIKSGGSGVWGAIPMPAQGLTDADASILANWIANGAGR
ncbi:MAG: cytochrome C [Comamonadaceae bacterium PBBC2]|nr:MAG: cytochrome C [Comamonadaceae bacterium PBBC2]